MSAVKLICTRADKGLLRSSAETLLDNWKLIHPVRVVSETGHEGSFHGAMESLHHAISLRMIGCSAEGLYS